MDGQALKTLAQTRIYAKLKALFEPGLPATLNPADKAVIDKSWQDLADAVSDAMIDIVTHIQTTAVVSTNLIAPAVAVTVSGAPGSGAVTNPAATGTVT